MRKIIFSAVFVCVAISAKAQMFRPVEDMTDVERSYFLAEHFWVFGTDFRLPIR